MPPPAFPRLAWPLFGLALVAWFWPVPWSFWTDEFFTAGMVGRDFGAVLQGVAHDRHPPLYFLGVWALGHLTNTDNGLRALSGLGVTLAWLTTVDAARRHFSLRTTLAIAAWFAASAVPALFAHTLRMYAWVSFAGAGMLWGALEASVVDEARARRGRWALAAAGILAFWTHYAAVLVGVAAFAAAGLTELVGPRRPSRLFALAGCAGAVVAGCLPWLLGPFGAQFAERDPVGAAVWEVWAYLFWSPNEHLPPLTFVAALAVLGGGLWLWRRGPPAVRALAGVFLVSMVVLPFLASKNVPARLVRNYVGFFPVAAVFAGAALDALVARLGREAAWTGAALALALSAPLTIQLLSEPFHPQDINAGHDYRLEAKVLEAMIPAEASVRFQPDYVVGQFARYEPTLRERTGKPNPSWQLLTSGGKASDCLILHGFRVRVQPPSDACEAALAVLSKAADDTGYPGFLLDRAARAVAAGQLDAAAADVARALAEPQRWPVGYIVAAQLAEARKDDVAALAAYTEALRMARAYEPPGKVTSTLWRKVAKLRAGAGDPEGAAAAEAASVCAAEREPAWACGGPLAWATRAAEGLEGDDDAPKATMSPAPDATAATVATTAQPVATDPTSAGAAVAPVATEAQSAPTTAAPGHIDLSGGLPAGWSSEGAVAPGGGGVVIGDGAGTVSSICSPVTPLSGPVAGTVTRGAEITAGPPPTWSRIEARALGADKRPVPGVKPENLLSKKENQPMETVSFRWTPPPGAAAWRLCIKTGGAAMGTTTVVAVDVGD